MVNIRYLNGSVVSLGSMQGTDTIDQMKDTILSLVEISDSIPKNRIVLIYNNQRLQSNRTLSYYGITNDSTVLYAYAKNPIIISNNV